MKTTLKELGYQVKIHRDEQNLTQQILADKLKISATIISNLENGKMPTDKNNLKTICEAIKLPKPIWETFLSEKFQKRLEFERLLEEMYGEEIFTDKLDNIIISVIEDKISDLFHSNLTKEQTLDCVNSILLYYAISPISKEFFDYYLSKNTTFSTLTYFQSAIEKIKIDSIRLFSSINEAYISLNSIDKDFHKQLFPIQENGTEEYTKRTNWDKITKIPDKDLPWLGYIAAKKEEERRDKRKELAGFLTEIADKIKEKTNYDIQNSYSEKKLRKMESLLKELSTIKYGFYNSLFNPDESELRKEAARINPTDEDFVEMAKIQDIAYHNLSNYLASDYMDVYVATSMRSDADFVSVNQFVENLFEHNDIRQLKLRYFNPTQSWIGDRIAKGLVEALMLKRAELCIYMAQESDTFGKDSEASVTLGQGKAVIVYVPKLCDRTLGIDTEQSGKEEWAALYSELEKISTDKLEIDPKESKEQLHARLIHKKLEKATDDDYYRIIKNHWADFDIEGKLDNIKNVKNEVDEKNNKIRTELKIYLQEVIAENDLSFKLSKDAKQKLRDILVAASMKSEDRAKIFREVHPLALQVILDSGVLNGILVTRSIDSCAKLVKSIIENKFEIEIREDDNNYKLIEKNTLSTIRVISKHKLIANSFKTFYKKKNYQMG